jgi:hypothetical protein
VTQTRPSWVWLGLAALATALWADLLFAIGWTFEACAPVPGTNYGFGEAGYGLPFPYMQWGGGSSLEYVWIPGIFATNLALLALLGLVLGWRARFWLGTGWRRWAVVVLLSLGIGLQFMRINAFMVATVDDFRAGEVRIAPSELRPEGLYFGTGGYDCKPSSFWFPEHRR